MGVGDKPEAGGPSGPDDKSNFDRAHEATQKHFDKVGTVKDPPAKEPDKK